jgi:hypothetical protein
MVVRFCVLVAVVVLLAGCGGRDWNEGWRDGEGTVVPENVVSTGKPECVDNAVFLYVGWPLGTPGAYDTFDSAREYVRAPDGLHWMETVGALDTDATLPQSARNTGYHLGDLQLWLGRDAHKAAYLVEGSKVERWPRLVEPIGCA